MDLICKSVGHFPENTNYNQQEYKIRWWWLVWMRIIGVSCPQDQSQVINHGDQSVVYWRVSQSRDVTSGWFNPWACVNPREDKWSNFDKCTTCQSKWPTLPNETFETIWINLSETVSSQPVSTHNVTRLL